MKHGVFIIVFVNYIYGIEIFFILFKLHIVHHFISRLFLYIKRIMITGDGERIHIHPWRLLSSFTTQGNQLLHIKELSKRIISTLFTSIKELLLVNASLHSRSLSSSSWQYLMLLLGHLTSFCVKITNKHQVDQIIHTWL